MHDGNEGCPCAASDAVCVDSRFSSSVNNDRVVGSHSACHVPSRAIVRHRARDLKSAIAEGSRRFDADDGARLQIRRRRLEPSAVRKLPAPRTPTATGVPMLAQLCRKSRCYMNGNGDYGLYTRACNAEIAPITPLRLPRRSAFIACRIGTIMMPL